MSCELCQPVRYRSLIERDAPTGTILIADDHPDTRCILHDLLAPLGHRLICAHDGAEAYAQALRHQPDLILLDVNMPRLDGLEVCRRLRATVQLAEVPILMLTALADRRDRLNGLAAGADDFLIKPFDVDELLARVRTIMRLNRYRLLHQARRHSVEVALQSATLLSDAYDQTLRGWVKALELRDEETEAHSQRVTALTLNLARFAGISGGDLLHIERGALLHDIGKLGIPDAILLKPGPLEPHERQVIEQHPLHAHAWLAPIHFLRPALAIPYSHHEKWDGSGYPQGLRRDEIPLAARLFAVVDVWDALTSNRPYRCAVPLDQAQALIQAGRGTHFDPEIVDLFLGNVVNPSLNGAAW
ncbi:MAG: HD domain-containing phosphohydrolase [Oscillochloridaceae bacterium umkhey_bin13]